MAIEARPSEVMLGLDVYLATHDGAPSVRALVASEVLEELYKSGTSQAGWLRAYREHASDIDAVLRRKQQATPGQPVVVTLADFNGAGVVTTKPSR